MHDYLPFMMLSIRASCTRLRKSTNAGKPTRSVVMMYNACKWG